MLQDFARLIFGSGPSMGCTFCKVNVAPMDLMACQHTLLRVSAFLAEALPPPELNPVHMRVNVSLREILQDSLKGLHQHKLAVADLPSYEVLPSACLPLMTT